MSGKLLITLLAIIGVVAVLLGQAEPSRTGEFEAWMTKFSIKYESKFEEAYRKRFFHENLAKIEKHNSDELRTYNMGVNQFTALTDEEFKQTYLGTIVNEDNIEVAKKDYISVHKVDISASNVDWVSKGAVTPVKNQGQCVSGWAFSAAGAIESAYFLKQKSLKNISAQQLVDCARSNMGCNGGYLERAFDWVTTRGLSLESDYPYTAKQGTCQRSSGPFTIGTYTQVVPNPDCSPLLIAVSNRPVSVAVDASNWKQYSSGIFSDCGTNLNHAALLVVVSDSFYTVKNSWSTSWGEKGFIRLNRYNNPCGLCSRASFPNI